MEENLIKDPDAVLDYKWDWSDWLEDGETIDTLEVGDLAGGIALASGKPTPVVADSSTSVVAWFEGGTTDTVATARCRITTTAGRTDDRTMRIFITER